MNFKRNRILYFILFSLCIISSIWGINSIFLADGVRSFISIISALLSLVQIVFFIFLNFNLKLNGYYSSNMLFFVAPLCLFFKKIYSSEYGYFFLFLNKQDDTIILYRQGIFSIQEIDKFRYSGSIEELSLSIKRSLDSVYKSEIIKNNRNDRFTEWNGFLDKKSERDGKLNNLGIKD